MSESWECVDILGFPDERQLEPGVLDEDAAYVFMHGHCHSLAEALRRLQPAAELVMAYEPLDEDEDAVGQVHILVRIDGRPLDVRGWLDELEDDRLRNVEAFWGRTKIIGHEGWLESGSGWFDLRTDDAVPFALALLAKVGLKADPTRRFGDLLDLAPASAADLDRPDEPS